MKARVFTLQVGEDGQFDDSALQAFFEHADALVLSEHFFVHDGRPTLALVVQYRDAVSRVSRGDARKSPPRGEPPVEVAPEDKILWEALRTWRNARSRKDGVPAYVLFTNAQLAAIATVRPTSRAALAAVEGVGDARIRDYAEEVLALVATYVTPALVEGRTNDADAAAGA